MRHLLTMNLLYSYLPSDEAALYDRQIRLWGLEAQQRSVHLLFRVPRLPIPPPLWAPKGEKRRGEMMTMMMMIFNYWCMTG
jgi:hypothetical protein